MTISSKSSSGISTQILETDAEFSDIREDWERLYEVTRGSLFQSFEWMSTWWRVFGQGQRMRVLLVSVDGILVGIVPCFIERWSQCGVSFRRLRMMGERSIYGEYVPLVLPDHLSVVVDATAAMFRDALLRHEVDTVDCHHFPTGSPFFREVMEQLRGFGLRIRFEERSLARLTIATPPSVKDYMASLSYRERRHRVRREHSLEQQGAKLEMIPAQDDEKAFHDFVELHTKTWVKKGQGGFFQSRERFTEFLHAITVEQGTKNDAYWFFLSKAGVRFAGLLVFFRHGDCCTYVSGRDPDHELARFSPGIVVMNYAMVEAISRQCRIIDLQEGDTPYKFKMGGVDVGMSRMTAYFPGIRGLRGMLNVGVLAFSSSRLWKKHLEPMITRWQS